MSDDSPEDLEPTPYRTTLPRLEPETRAATTSRVDKASRANSGSITSNFTAGLRNIPKAFHFSILPGPFLTGLLIFSALIWFYDSYRSSQQQSLTSRIIQLESDLSVLKQNTVEFENLRTELRSSRAALKAPSSDEPISERVFTSRSHELDDPFFGPKDAEILLMVFSDFQCRQCRTFHDSVIPKLNKEYAEQGKIRLIFRDFPLESNLQAIAAASFAHCAGEQGRYWQAFSILNQEQKAVDDGKWDTLAQSISGIDQDKFALCRKSGKYEIEIAHDRSDAEALGVKGVPTIFVARRTAPKKDMTGVLIRGAQPYAVIQHELDKILLTN